MELASFTLDILLMVIGVFVAWKVIMIMRAQTESNIGLLLIGGAIILIGFIHLSETFLYISFNIDQALNELIHRLLNLFAFILLALGFYILQRETEAKIEKEQK